jgi:hypothetical protein
MSASSLVAERQAASQAELSAIELVMIIMQSSSSSKCIRKCMDCVACGNVFMKYLYNIATFHPSDMTCRTEMRERASIVNYGSEMKLSKK